MAARGKHNSQSFELELTTNMPIASRSSSPLDLDDLRSATSSVDDELGDLSEQARPERSESYSSNEEQAVIKKLDRRLVLFLALLYMLAFLDRSSTSRNLWGIQNDTDWYRHRKCEDSWPKWRSESQLFWVWMDSDELLLHLYRISMDDTPLPYYSGSCVHLSLRGLVGHHCFVAIRSTILSSHVLPTRSSRYRRSSILSRCSISALVFLQEGGARIANRTLYFCCAPCNILCRQPCMADHEGLWQSSYRDMEITVSSRGFSRDSFCCGSVVPNTW